MPGLSFRHFRRLTSLLAVLLAALGASHATAQVRIVFTADTQGHVGPCESCPGMKGLGTLGRRQTLFSTLRKQDGAFLLVDAGNALFGGDSLPSGGKVIVAAYNALGYDAVNLGYQDFRLDKAATMAALAEAKFTPLSANLLDAATGQPLFHPYVVKPWNGRKIALIGLSESPAALPMLPTLQKQLAGVRIETPIEALGKVLPKARAESDAIVLLYDGSPTGLIHIRQKFAGQIDFICVSGVGPGDIPPAGSPPLFATLSHGRAAAEVTAQPGKPPTVRQWAVLPDLAQDPAIQKLIAGYPIGGGTIHWSPTTHPTATPQPLDKLQPGQSARLNLLGRNRAVELRIDDVSLLDHVGDAPAPRGERFLVIHTRFRNLQSPKLVNGRLTPMAYLVKNLSDNLYLVADRAHLLSRAGINAGGLLPTRSLALKEQNDMADGKLVYAVPRDHLPADLTLRFYDFSHGNIVIPLVRSGNPSDQKPDVPPRKNKLLEMAIDRLEESRSLNGQAAPEGMEYVSVDLRARSLFTTQADAAAYDPKAKPGETIEVGAVADWKDSRRYQQLLVDGDRAYAPLPQSGLPELPRFLPDVMTGGRLVFLIPSTARSLSLLCGFPNARLPDGNVIHPAPLRFELRSSSTSPASNPSGSPIAAIKDDAFDVAVVSQHRAEKLAGQDAGRGKAFVLLDFKVTNSGAANQFFQPKAQLKYAAEDGSQLEADPVSAKIEHPAVDPLWIPPGEDRRFSLAYRIDAKETRPRLAYRGVSLAKVVHLQPMNAAVAQVPVRQPPKTAATTTKPPQPPATMATAAPVKPSAAPAPAPQPVKSQPPKAAATAEPGLPTVPVHPKLKPQGLAGVGVTPEQVNQAIDRGRAFLWDYIKTHDLKGHNDRFGQQAEHSLAMLALVHAGAQTKFPDFDAALRDYLGHVKITDYGSSKTYRVGLLCMTLSAYGDTQYRPLLQKAARYLIEAQGPGGTWDYGRSFDAKIFHNPELEKVLQVNGGIPLNGKGAVIQPLARLTPWKDGGDGDNSNTQYALLGLSAAMRADIKPPADLWQRALAAQRKGQSSQGGWGYNAGNSPYGSMTTSGICDIAICRHGLGEAHPEIDPQIEQGLAWLDRHFSVEENPPHGNGWNYYYLYSLERVGQILNTPFIGKHEWYPLGVKHLLGAQRADGSWVGKSSEQDPRLATGFALLFLTRATPSLNLAIQHGGDGTLNTAAVAGVQRLYIILDASGSMLAQMNGKYKFDIARDAVASIIKLLPDTAQVALRVYGSQKNALQPDADQDTTLTVPMSKLDKPKFLETLGKLRARGKTPLALSLKDALADLSGDEPTTVLLLTDGGEDTRPRQDPVAAAAQFAAHKNLRLRIVGFDINRPDWTSQLTDMAKAAHAIYWPASRAQALQEDVRAAVLGTPTAFTVQDASGKKVTDGRFGQKIKLPEGQYHFITDFAGRRFDSTFWINTDAMTTILFDGDNAAKTSAAATPATAQPAPNTPSPVAMQYCPYCGFKLPPNAKFCPHCGHKIP